MADRVLILGGGMAGVACAQRLAHEQVDVTLVDRNDYCQFQPLLYQVACAQLPAEDVARPHRAIFRHRPTVDVVTGEVVAADLARRSVELGDGRRLVGSNLVVAAGGQPNFFGVPGAADHAFPLYSVADAERLRLHLRRLVRDGESRGDASDGGLFDVVVVGGGPTGVEVTGALTELMAALRRSQRLPHTGQIAIVQHGHALLHAFAPRAQHYARHKLDAAGATVMLGVRVTAVHPDRVVLDTGRVLRARTVIWGGGELGSAVVQHAGSETGHGGRLDVRPDLGITGAPHTYAVGDAANIPSGTGHTLPQLGSVAQQSGGWAADNILREQRGEPTRPFAYDDKGIMAMIGRNAAVAEVGRHRHEVEGPLAFAAWLGVHAALLSGVHSTIDAFLTWAWDYFDRDHAAAVAALSAPPRIVWRDDDEDAPTIRLDRRPAAQT